MWKQWLRIRCKDDRILLCLKAIIFLMQRTLREFGTRTGPGVALISGGGWVWAIKLHIVESAYNGDTVVLSCLCNGWPTAGIFHLCVWERNNVGLFRQGFSAHFLDVGRRAALLYPHRKVLNMTMILSCCAKSIQVGGEPEYDPCTKGW